MPQYADVTVVTPTRNRPAILKRALDSIARQTFSRYEAFVVDDGSGEEHAAEYREILKDFDERFHVLQPLRPGETGSGPAVSRNRGMAAGTAPYIAFLDDDDVWTWERHLETAIDALERSGLDLYCAEMQGFQGDRVLIDRWLPDHGPLLASPRIGERPPLFHCSRAAFVEAARHRTIHPNMLVLRRTLVDRVGGFLNSLRYAEDTEFVLRLIDGVEAVLFCPTPVARYRLPEGNAHSLTMSRTQQELQTLAAAQHMKIMARTPEVRRAATSIEAWTLRVLSHGMAVSGQRWAAIRLALQSLIAQTTLGGVAHLAKTACLPARTSEGSTQ